MRVLEKQLEETLESLSERDYPKQCSEGTPFNYVGGVRDGLKEALQLVRMRQNRYKVVGNIVEVNDGQAKGCKSST